MTCCPDGSATGEGRRRPRGREIGHVRSKRHIGEGGAPDVRDLRQVCPSRHSARQMTDRLSLTNALTDANIDRQKAERIATEIFDAIHDNVATKQDLQALEAKLELVKHQLITRLGGLMVVLAGLLFAALHYWPPHG